MNARLALPVLCVLACSDIGIHGTLKHVDPGLDTAGADDSPTDADADADSDADTDADADADADTDTDTDADPPRPDEFSLGWHILDENTPIATNSSASHLVDHHGDIDLYWYEPSGVHGLSGSTDPDADFELMRDYVLERVPEPNMGIGLLHYYSDSEIDTFELATFTYILCDFWVDADDDAALYELVTGPVDDGIQVMANGAVLGHLKLDDPGGSWTLGPHIRLGERNTLIVLLVDDSARNKFVQDMAFYRDGVMVMGEDIGPPPG